jgi:predicted ATPase/DNA-binding SARP family transcriptional activator/tetratricopeptide (TPR) repeat protein
MCYNALTGALGMAPVCVNQSLLFCFLVVRQSMSKPGRTVSATNILRISTLGRVAIERDGLAITDLASRKVEALLIYLACTGRHHPRELLADLLWDDRSQRQAMANLRVVLSSLRKTLGPFVSISRTTAALDPGTHLSLDTSQLEAAVSAAQSAQGIHSSAAAEQLSAAVALYHGDFLAGFFVTEAAGFETWAAAERERLHRLALDGLQRLGRWYLSEGQYGEAMAASTRLLELDPLAEAGHRQLMEALARRGQRSEALAVYEGLEATLWRELGVEPARATRELLEAIQADRLAVPRAAEGVQAKPPIRLPAPATSLLGRETELDEIKTLFFEQGARLLTIVGPGGVGKTSLALEAARQLVDHFAGGAAFISLAPLLSDEAIVPSLAQALQFKPEGGETRDAKNQLLDYLADKRLLLVLDNFEHLLGGAPLLTEILIAATQVKLLVTSRERLKLQAEHVYPLQGIPFSFKETVEEAKRSPAVQLFLQHGKRVRSGYEPQVEDIEALQQILQLVEGMPLAIILAASWLELLSPLEIAAEIERSLGFLEADYRDLPQRQRSMRAVFETTWARLDEWEQTHFAALSVFRGGFTLEAARAVVGAAPRDLLGLAGRSLLARGENGRFQVHELLRQFAAEQLSRFPDRERAVREQHSTYYMNLLGKLEPELRGPNAAAVLAEIASDIQNHQAAWALANARQAFAQLGAAAFALATFHLRYGRFHEGLSAFDEAVRNASLHLSGQGEASSEDVRALVCLLAWQCEIWFTIGSTNEAEASGLQAVALLQRPELAGHDARPERALAQLALARVYEWIDRYQEATELLEESVALFRSLGQQWYMADAIHLLGGIAMRRGKYELAIQRMKEAEQYYTAAGDYRSVAYVRMWAGICQTWLWPSREAEKQIKESLTIFRQVGDRGAECWALYGLQWASLSEGRFEEAAAHGAEASAVLARLGKTELQALMIQDMGRIMVLKGEYARGLAQLAQAQEIAAHIETPIRIANLLLLTGCARVAQGYSEEARQIVTQGILVLRDIGQYDELSWALAVRSCVQLQCGEVAESREALEEALTLAHELRSFISIMYALPAAALFLTYTGDIVRAVEVWKLASRYAFIANSRWFEDVIGRHVSAAAAGLAPEQIAAAQTRGETLDPWETARELLQQLTTMDL